MNANRIGSWSPGSHDTTRGFFILRFSFNSQKLKLISASSSATSGSPGNSLHFHTPALSRSQILFDLQLYGFSYSLCLFFCRLFLVIVGILDYVSIIFAFFFGFLMYWPFSYFIIRNYRTVMDSLLYFIDIARRCTLVCSMSLLELGL